MKWVYCLRINYRRIVGTDERSAACSGQVQDASYSSLINIRNRRC
eukprot:COSAG06_NODE_66709_length_253_cov_1.681818_1_plen_44_part_01